MAELFKLSARFDRDLLEARNEMHDAANEAAELIAVLYFRNKSVSGKP